MRRKTRVGWMVRLEAVLPEEGKKADIRLKKAGFACLMIVLTIDRVLRSLVDRNYRLNQASLFTAERKPQNRL